MLKREAIALFGAFLQKHFGLDNPSLVEQLETDIQMHFAEKGVQLCVQHESSGHLYFMLKGWVRYVVNDQTGKAFTKYFVCAPGITGSTRALVTGQAAQFSIEIMEPSLYLAIEWRALMRLIESDHSFSLAYCRLLEALFIDKEQREYNLVLTSPEQRYLTFFDRFPQLRGKVTQQDIASYIGITPVALSRIRQRLKHQQE